MARMTIKSTYSLDVETVHLLEALARQWKVSKSEALRRAIGAAAKSEGASEKEAIQALNELQRSLRLNRSSAQQWETQVRAERRASAGRTKK